jgi:hypothetical protein
MSGNSSNMQHMTCDMEQLEAMETARAQLQFLRNSVPVAPPLPTHICQRSKVGRKGAQWHTVVCDTVHAYGQAAQACQLPLCAACCWRLNRQAVDRKVCQLAACC